MVTELPAQIEDEEAASPIVGVGLTITDTVPGFALRQPGRLVPDTE
jgi:hypothetical protein